MSQDKGCSSCGEKSNLFNDLCSSCFLESMSLPTQLPQDLWLPQSAPPLLHTWQSEASQLISPTTEPGRKRKRRASIAAADTSYEIPVPPSSELEALEFPVVAQDPSSCSNCSLKAVSKKNSKGLCGPCDAYQRRTGRDRPESLYTKATRKTPSKRSPSQDKSAKKRRRTTMRLDDSPDDEEREYEDIFGDYNEQSEHQEDSSESDSDVIVLESLQMPEPGTRLIVRPPKDKAAKKADTKAKKSTHSNGSRSRSPRPVTPQTIDRLQPALRDNRCSTCNEPLDKDKAHWNNIICQTCYSGFENFFTLSSDSPLAKARHTTPLQAFQAFSTTHPALGALSEKAQTDFQQAAESKGDETVRESGQPQVSDESSQASTTATVSPSIKNASLPLETPGSTASFELEQSAAVKDAASPMQPNASSPSVSNLTPAVSTWNSEEAKRLPQEGHSPFRSTSLPTASPTQPNLLDFPYRPVFSHSEEPISSAAAVEPQSTEAKRTPAVNSDLSPAKSSADIAKPKKRSRAPSVSTAGKSKPNESSAGLQKRSRDSSVEVEIPIFRPKNQRISFADFVDITLVSAATCPATTSVPKEVESVTTIDPSQTLHAPTASIDRARVASSELGVPASAQEPVVVDDSISCCICLDLDSLEENQIVICEMCDVAVHEDCYGVGEIPEGDWLCQKCKFAPDEKIQCSLCPVAGGALRRASNDTWVHTSCSSWMPGCHTLGDEDCLVDMKKIDPDRYKLKCSKCSTRKGAAIQCQEKRCFRAYHVTCARQDGLSFDLDVDANMARFYCHLHSAASRAKAKVDKPATTPVKKSTSAKVRTTPTVSKISAPKPKHARPWQSSPIGPKAGRSSVASTSTISRI